VIVDEYEYGVQWQSRTYGRRLAVDEWYATADEAKQDRDRTEAILSMNGRRATRFNYVLVRRRKAGPIEQMEREKCAENECRPDITGMCIDCGHEVARDVDSDGDPL
jgi:hypothetical protein